MNRLGDQCRKRVGLAFRKKLGMFNYKVKEPGVKKIRNPGAVPLDVKKGDHHSLMKLKELERDSYYPYGKFFFDESKTHLFNVPDLTGFQLKPYVSYRTPKVTREQLEDMRKLNDFSQPDVVTRFSDSPESSASRNLDPK